MNLTVNRKNRGNRVNYTSIKADLAKTDGTRVFLVYGRKAMNKTKIVSSRVVEEPKTSERAELNSMTAALMP